MFLPKSPGGFGSQEKVISFRDKQSFNACYIDNRCNNTFHASVNNLFNFKQLLFNIYITRFFNIYCKLDSKNLEAFEVPY